MPAKKTVDKDIKAQPVKTSSQETVTQIDVAVSMLENLKLRSIRAGAGPEKSLVIDECIKEIKNIQ
jgi:hypothetical protein